MQQNEFEKQVKEMMDDFYVVPSEPVWNKIKKQLQEKRRRVWPFIFLLFAVILISGTIMYFNTKTNNQSKEKENVLNDKKEQFNRTKNQEIKKQNSLITDSVNAKKKIEAIKNYQNSNNQFVDVKPLQKQHNILNADKKFSFKNDEKQLKANASQNSQVINDNETAKNVAERKNEIINVDKNVQPNPTSAFQKQSNTDSLTTIALSKNNSTINDTSKNVLMNTDTSNKIMAQITKPDSSQTKKKPLIQKNKNNKLQFGITAFVGKSNITNSFLNSEHSFANDVAAFPGNSIGDTSSASRNLPSKLYTPSTSFGLGFTVTKPIARHLFISSGLNYLYLSATTKTSSRVDSLVSLTTVNQTSFSLNNYYRNGSENFTNRFHFIELPVYFRQDFINTKKFSVSYNTGFSVMQLIAAHALIYDAGKNIFYSQNSLLNHTQFQLAAGLNFQFNLKNKTAILVGPQMRYSLSAFSKNTNNNNLHYSNYGLQLNWFFKK